ncbi:MAG: chemotaxis protein CheA [Oligoflexales bacterium]
MTEIEADIELLQEFMEEGSDILTEWESSSIELEKEPLQKPQILANLSRSAHNLKGVSKSIGLVAFSEFVHKVEDFIVFLQEKDNIRVDQAIRILLDSKDIMLSWLQNAIEDISFVPQQRCEEIDKLIEEYIHKKDHTEDSNSADDDDFEFVAPATTVSASSEENVDSKDDDEEEEDDDDGFIKIEPNNKKEDNAKTENIQYSNKRKTLRVATDKIDYLVRMAGELSIHTSIIDNFMNRVARQLDFVPDSVNQITKISRVIQRSVLSLRLQPVKDLFQKLERAAYDVARIQEKKIDVEILGDDIELDKSVLEAVGDSLIHTVRNAVDHGIEKPDVRKEKNKFIKGLLTIEAIKEIDGIKIIIEDDGKGLDKEGILKKAVERGLVNPSTNLTAEEIHEFIFLPGFSTAEKLSQISGRGVGMEVLKQSVEAIGGKVKISSEPNKGTILMLLIPTSLNSIEVLGIKCGKIKYAVPLDSIDEVIQLKDDMCKMVGGQKMIEIRGELFPIYSMESCLPPVPDFDQEGGSEDSWELSNMAIMIKSNGKNIAFQVDGVSSHFSVTIKNLAGSLKVDQTVGGATIFSDGTPGLIINPKKLLANVNLELS